MTTLSQRSMRIALKELLAQDDVISEGRSEYVGSSEVGACPRLVSFRKGTGLPWDPDSDAAGVLYPGRLAETAVLAMLTRMGLGSILEATGDAQAVMAHDGLKGHPDGLWMKPPVLDSSISICDEHGRVIPADEARAIMCGDGILEVKSGSNAVVKDAIRSGISPVYRDQVVSNMGLFGRGWALLIYISRENFSKIAFFLIKADPARYEELKVQKTRILEAASVIRFSHPDPVKPEDAGSIESLLLEADKDRGFCQSCPISDSCPALCVAGDSGIFPEEVLDTVQALAEIYREGAEQEKAGKESKDDARDRLVALGALHHAVKAPLGGALKSVSISHQRGREGVDAQRLKTDFPEAYAACRTEGEPFSVVRVTPVKKD